MVGDGEEGWDTGEVDAVAAVEAVGDVEDGKVETGWLAPSLGDEMVEEATSDGAATAADDPACTEPATVVEALVVLQVAPLYPPKLNPAGTPALTAAVVCTAGGSGTEKQAGGNSRIATQPATPFPASASPPTAILRC